MNCREPSAYVTLHVICLSLSCVSMASQLLRHGAGHSHRRDQRHSATAGAMHSCMAPRAGQAALLSRGCTACSHAGMRQQASTRHAAALQHRRRPALCQAKQQDAEQGEQQAEAPMSEL